MTLTEQMTELARQAKAASRQLARLSTADKNACLLAMANALEQNSTAIKTANALDLEAAATTGLSAAMLDRLQLDDKRIGGMAKGLREVAALPDPVGKVLVIKHYKGVCHVYVDGEADLKMAEEIAMNTKVQRPAVCNAMETLLVDSKIAKTFLPNIGRRLGEKKVQLRVDANAEAILKSDNQDPKTEIRRATEEDFYTEYNDYI